MANYFEVTIIGSKSAQQIINRLNFTSSNEDPLTSTSLGLLQAMGFDPLDPSAPVAGKMLDTFLAAQTANYEIQEITVRNLFSVFDFITQPVTGIGWQGQIVVGAGDGLQTFVAAKLRTNRIRTDVRRGTLSITGGTEEQTEGLDLWTSAYLGLLTDLAAAINTGVIFTSGASSTTFQPSVFGKERYEVPDSDPVRYAYRYYKVLADFQAHAAVGVTWSPVERVSSQVSRKIGRGA